MGRGREGARGRGAEVTRPEQPLAGRAAHPEARCYSAGALGLRRQPRHVRALAVATVAEVEVDRAAFVAAAVEHGVGALVRVHVAREDEIGVVRVEERPAWRPMRVSARRREC